MPIFSSDVQLPAAPAAVFALLRRPSALAELAPPEMHLRVENGPEELALGASFILRGRRWGMPQRVVSAVTALEVNALLVLEQRQGPFRRWIHTQRLEAQPDGGTLLREEVDYERPGGLLGLTVTAAFLERELASLFEFRRIKLAELLGE